MSTFALRLPDSLYAHVKRLAEQDQASLNQFITVAVAEKVSALHTADFFAERAGKSKREALALFLQQVEARVPLAGDEKA
jgi:predicted transcriptional regulator